MSRKKANAGPATVHLTARLAVFESAAWGSGSGFMVAEGRDPQGRAFALTADLVGKRVVLARDGLPPRAVTLENLVSAMLMASPAPPPKGGGP